MVYNLGSAEPIGSSNYLLVPWKCNNSTISNAKLWKIFVRFRELRKVEKHCRIVTNTKISRASNTLWITEIDTSFFAGSQKRWMKTRSVLQFKAGFNTHPVTNSFFYSGIGKAVLLNFSRSHLMWSLWARTKLMTLTGW